MAFLKFVLMALMPFSSSAESRAGVAESDLQSALMSQSQCGNFVRHDEKNLYLGFGTYSFGLGKSRDPRAAKFRSVELGSHRVTDYSTMDSVVDIVTFGTKAYVLTYSSLEEWDLQTQRRVDLHDTHIFNQDMGRFEHAVAMAPYGDKLIIAHGRRGLSVFDTQKNALVDYLRLVEEYAPLESKATAIAVHEDYAYVVLDSHHLVKPPQKQPFRGIVIVDLKTLQIVQQLDGMDVGSDGISVDDKFVVVSFGGQPIWKFDRHSLFAAKTLPRPLEYVWSFPVKGHPTGKPLLGATLYFTCYLAPPTPGSGGRLYQNIPMVLERQQIKLGN